jgi:hypothetical protein
VLRHWLSRRRLGPQDASPSKSQLDTELGSRVDKRILIVFVATIETGNSMRKAAFQIGRGLCLLNANLVRSTPHPGFVGTHREVKTALVGASTDGDCPSG